MFFSAIYLVLSIKILVQAENDQNLRIEETADGKNTSVFSDRLNQIRLNNGTAEKECKSGVGGKCVPEVSAIPQGNFSNVCQQQKDGKYPDYETGCRQYYRCEGEKTISKSSCPKNHIFSFSQEICVPASLATCVEPMCLPTGDEVFWLSGNLCRSYYICRHSMPILFNCPRGKQFDKINKICVTTGASPCYEPICTGKIDGNHPDTTHNCQRYLRCKGGMLRGVTNCPSGQKYNGSTCVAAESVQCASPTSTAVAVEAIHDDCRGYSNGPHVIPETNCHRYQICRDGKSIAQLVCPNETIFNGLNCVPKNTSQCKGICAGKVDGYYTNEGCRKYHYCKEGKMKERHSCSDGTMFSGIMCLPKALAKCNEEIEHRVQNPCLGLSNGFHGDYLKGCNNYFHCSNFSLTQKLTCLENQIWRYNSCIASKDGYCKSVGPSSDCEGLPTGLYQDQIECSKYFYCYQGRKVLLYCEKGQVFNGDKCVDKDEYTCMGLEANSCIGKEDGYRVNKESGCKSYYFCSNKYKMTYVCPNGENFNGTKCVAEGEYKCPYTENVCNNKANGYYPDFSKKCKKYYYCSNGNKLNTFDCGKHKMFDGRQCIFTSSDAVCRQMQKKLSRGNMIFGTTANNSGG